MLFRSKKPELTNVDDFLVEAIDADMGRVPKEWHQALQRPEVAVLDMAITAVQQARNAEYMKLHGELRKNYRVPRSWLPGLQPPPYILSAQTRKLSADRPAINEHIHQAGLTLAGEIAMGYALGRTKKDASTLTRIGNKAIDVYGMDNPKGSHELKLRAKKIASSAYGPMHEMDPLFMARFWHAVLRHQQTYDKDPFPLDSDGLTAGLVTLYNRVDQASGRSSMMPDFGPSLNRAHAVAYVKACRDIDVQMGADQEESLVTIAGSTEAANAMLAEIARPYLTQEIGTMATRRTVRAFGSEPY
jgi:hypothetical protein